MLKLGHYKRTYYIYVYMAPVRETKKISINNREKKDRPFRRVKSIER